MFGICTHRGAGLLAVVVCMAAPAYAGHGSADTSTAVPAVLTEPAQITPKALGAAMLALTRAGDRLVAVGERGTVLLSDDDGLHWRQASVPVPVRVSLTAVHFGDARRGWAVGHLGVILATTDGGETWAIKLDGVRAAQANAQAIRAGGDERATQRAQQWLDEGPDKPFFDIDIDARGYGYAVGAYNLAFTTRDGGQTWEPLSVRLPNPKGLHLYGVKVTGSDVYIVGEQGLVMRSDDDGAHFASQASPYKGSLFGLLVTHSGVLVAHGLRGKVVRSGDGGQSWQAVETGYPASLTAAAEAADGALVLLGQGGDLLISRDAGQTFSHQTPTAGPAPSASLIQTAHGPWLLAGLRGLRTQTTP
jgi:photosystem II stability/assembly factor-like uncharacterized protein